tara:strand:+ start:1918 stop:2442 length:525 start_codon:yes stop_codon:yes gene_type:complete
MALTDLAGRTTQSKLNSMSVDLIDVTLTTTIATHADGRVISQSIEIPNAVAVKGGSAIIQSIYLQNKDDSVESPALELIFAAENTAITSDISDAIEIVDADLVTAVFQGGVTVSNWSTLKPTSSEFALKTNIGLVVRAESDSRSIFVHTINRSGGDYTPSGTGKLSARIGIVKD